MRKLAGQDRAIFAALYAVVGTALFLFTSLQQAARAEDADANSEILQKVRSAWDHRREAVKTLQCEFTVHTAESNGFTTPPLGKVIESDRTYKFSMAGNKLALLDEAGASDTGSDIGPWPKIRVAFDGALNRTLFERPSWRPHAIEQKDDKPDPSLTHNAALISIWLSSFPTKTLEQFGCKTAEMTVVSAHTSHDGQECAELAMPRGSQGWRALVTVDPSRDYVPVRFCLELQGRVQMDSSIRYVADDAIGWRLDTWVIQRFNLGSLMHVFSGIVTGFTVNKPLADDLFTIQFPEGVKVQKLK